MSYEAARAAADADDARLSGDAMFALRHAKGRILGMALRSCKKAAADLAGVSIVLAVSSNGSISKSWRNGDTPLARCVQDELARSMMTGDWQEPFYTSIDLSRNEP